MDFKMCGFMDFKVCRHGSQKNMPSWTSRYAIIYFKGMPLATTPAQTPQWSFLSLAPPTNTRLMRPCVRPCLIIFLLFHFPRFISTKFLMHFLLLSRVLECHVSLSVTCLWVSLSVTPFKAPVFPPRQSRDFPSLFLSSLTNSKIYKKLERGGKSV